MAYSDKSIVDMNKFIRAFGSSMKAENEALSKIRVDIKLDNMDLNSTITSQIDNLKADLAAEKKNNGCHSKANLEGQGSE